MEKYKMIRFEENEFVLDVRIDEEKSTVWLTQEEMALLFDVDRTRIVRHISNILDDNELDSSTCAENAQVQNEGGRTIKRNIKIYNLDMIISVGYRVNSKRGIEFRKWANKILKEYLIEGISVNNKRLEALNKTVDIQNRMLSSTLEIDNKELSDVINEYTKSLQLLDDYDHQCLITSKGRTASYVLDYKTARSTIDSMTFGNKSEVFGLEKEEGKLEGILAQINQNVFGQELYPSLESKAAHLLYFIVKDHPFADGCKRIAATLFLQYLNLNKALFLKDGTTSISKDALVAITLLTAESKPDEIESIINVITNLIKH